MTDVAKLIALRNEMCGKKFSRKPDGSDVALVKNIHPHAMGFQVSFNYGAEYDVFVSFRKFIKRYPYRAEV